MKKLKGQNEPREKAGGWPRAWDQAILLIYLQPERCLGDSSGRATGSDVHNKLIHPGLPGAGAFFLGAYKHKPVIVLFG